MSILRALAAASTDLIQNGINEVDTGSSGTVESTAMNIINAVIYVAGILAVVVVVIGGVQYAVSQGDTGKLKKAKDTILYAVIGVVISILAYAIVNFVLSNVFGPESSEVEDDNKVEEDKKNDSGG